MKAPENLTLVARKAGISEELALKLWRCSASEAEILLGTCTSPEYHHRAMQGFLSRVDDESPNPIRQHAPHITWAWQQQERLSRLSLRVFHQACHDWNYAWRDCLKKAA